MANMVENLRRETDVLRATAILAPMDRYSLALSDHLLDEPSEPVAVMALLAEVLQSLNIIHSTGLGHSPLTPSSIKLTRDGRVRIESKSPVDPCQTIAFRSTKYSPPDAFQGNGGTASCEALDSYLLGFMFYELVLGRRLFSVEFADVVSGTELAWLNWHANRNRSARPLSDVLPSVPAPISRLIAGMMEKDPARRVTDLKQLPGRIQIATEATVLIPERKARQSGAMGPQREPPKSFWHWWRSNQARWRQKFWNGGGSGNAPRSVEMVQRDLSGLATSSPGRFVLRHAFPVGITLAILLLVVIRGCELEGF
jgi:serine/threonine protein kinase